MLRAQSTFPFLKSASTYPACCVLLPSVPHLPRLVPPSGFLWGGLRSEHFVQQMSPPHRHYPCSSMPLTPATPIGLAHNLFRLRASTSFMAIRRQRPRRPKQGPRTCATLLGRLPTSDFPSHEHPGFLSTGVSTASLLAPLLLTILPLPAQPSPPVLRTPHVQFAPPPTPQSPPGASHCRPLSASDPGYFRAPVATSTLNIDCNNLSRQQPPTLALSLPCTFHFPRQTCCN